MNSIFVHDLRVETRLGVYDWERHLPQTIRLDLELGLPSDKPFSTGDLADAVDYAAVVARVREFAAADPPPLLERFAQALAELLQDGFGAPWVSVRVAKLGALPGVREIGVAIERGRRP